MAARAAGQTAQTGGSSYLLVPILLLFTLLVVAVLRSPDLVSADGIGSAVIVLTPVVFSTYALMVIAIAGRATVDLSVGPLLGFANVTLVQLATSHMIESPLASFGWVIGVGVAYQLLMGLIIVFVRVQPIIVALSGYLALAGINLVILPRPGGTAPDWIQSWGLGTTIFSPVLGMLVAVTVLLLLIEHSAFFGHLRMMGYDERAAYTSGVPITLARLGAHAISGVLVGLAALAYTALIGSGDPTQGSTFTLVSITALVLGGTSLGGGRGSTVGSLLGGLNLFLIGYVLSTFSFGAIQGFVTDLSYGTILVLSLLLTLLLPWVERRVSAISPVLTFVLLAVIFGSVLLYALQAPLPSPPPVAGAAGGFILEGVPPTLSVGFTPIQKAAGLAVLVLVVGIGTARIAVTESHRRGMSVVLYSGLCVLLLAGLWVLSLAFPGAPIR